MPFTLSYPQESHMVGRASVHSIPVEHIEPAGSIVLEDFAAKRKEIIDLLSLQMYLADIDKFKKFIKLLDSTVLFPSQMLEIPAVGMAIAELHDTIISNEDFSKVLSTTPADNFLRDHVLKKIIAIIAVPVNSRFGGVELKNDKNNYTSAEETALYEEFLRVMRVIEIEKKRQEKLLAEENNKKLIKTYTQAMETKKGVSLDVHKRKPLIISRLQQFLNDADKKLNTTHSAKEAKTGLNDLESFLQRFAGGILSETKATGEKKTTEKLLVDKLKLVLTKLLTENLTTDSFTKAICEEGTRGFFQKNKHSYFDSVLADMSLILFSSDDQIGEINAISNTAKTAIFDKFKTVFAQTSKSNSKQEVVSMQTRAPSSSTVPANTP